MERKPLYLNFVEGKVVEFAPGDTIGSGYISTGIQGLVPGGGLAGEVLKKSTDADYDLEWGPGGAGSGDVVGPAGATDNRIAAFDGATGKLIKDGGKTIAEVLDTDNHTDGATNKVFSATEKTKLAGIEALADVTDAVNVAAAGAFMKAVDDTDDITVGAVNKFATAAEKTKLSNITITQAVDLDAIETRVNELDASVILKGVWDASAGTFPGGGVAQAGWSYIVSVAGTVDGVVFALNDRIIAIVDNASDTTFAANWFKADYTDQVVSVQGATGAVVITDANLPTSDVTTNDVTSAKHGFAPKSPGDATKFLNGAATPAYALVKDSDLSTTDITTNDVSSAKHGFAPKGDGDTGKFLNANGAYSTPTGGGGITIGQAIALSTFKMR